MNIETRLEEISKKIQELDALIDDTLDNEPEDHMGEYGVLIHNLFEDAAWIETCVGGSKNKEVGEI